LRLPFVSYASVDEIQLQSTHCLRSLLFCHVTEGWLVVSYRRFGTIYWALEDDTYTLSQNVSN